MNSTSGSVCARVTHARAGHGRGIQLRFSFSGNYWEWVFSHTQLQVPQPLSHLCPSSDNRSTECFPTGISLDHAEPDLHHFYSNVSK